ncbi:MAG: hypothetical protein H6659_13845 [Ardenticatenaceae bacterium]|nr:hypothetical protein [Ardenticatenaceae bacterium]
MRAQYRAYLLRLQRSQGQTHWRATLENAHTGELLRFANQNEMLRYLMQVLAVELPASDDQADANSL